MNLSEINMGVKFGGQPFVLLALVNYPQPDPYRQLAPHMLILDDGRGVNLGRIARISQNTAFQPTEQDTLFKNNTIVEQLLFAPRRLSRATIQQTSRQILGQIVGDSTKKYLSEAASPQRLNHYYPRSET